jgi:hypothetical protein
MKTLAIALIAISTALYFSLTAIDMMIAETAKAQETHKTDLNK